MYRFNTYLLVVLYLAFLLQPERKPSGGAPGYAPSPDSFPGFTEGCA